MTGCPLFALVGRSGLTSYLGGGRSGTAVPVSLIRPFGQYLAKILAVKPPDHAVACVCACVCVE